MKTLKKQFFIRDMDQREVCPAGEPSKRGTIVAFNIRLESHGYGGPPAERDGIRDEG